MLEAPDGRAALALLATASVDLISSDEMMPGLSGTELFEAVRARPGPRVPFLLRARPRRAHPLPQSERADGPDAAAFIREARLDEARRLLETPAYATVAEVAFAVGFDDAHYFGKVFVKRFGKRAGEVGR